MKSTEIHPSGSVKNFNELSEKVPATILFLLENLIYSLLLHSNLFQTVEFIKYETVRNKNR